MVEVLVRTLGGRHLGALAIGLVTSACSSGSEVCTGPGGCESEPASDKSQSSEPAPRPPVELGAEWWSINLGNSAALGGSARRTEDTFELLGGGGDVWGTADHAQFVYREVQGDFDLTVTVDRFVAEDLPSEAKAVLMFRARQEDSPHPTSKDAGVFQALTWNAGDYWYAREQPGSDISFETDAVSLSDSEATDLRIVRKGDVFSTYIRDESGSGWVKHHVDRALSLSQSGFAGFAVTSTNSELLEARFAGVHLTGSGGASRTPDGGASPQDAATDAEAPGLAPDADPELTQPPSPEPEAGTRTTSNTTATDGQGGDSSEDPTVADNGGSGATAGSGTDGRAGSGAVAGSGGTTDPVSGGAGGLGGTTATGGTGSGAGGLGGTTATGGTGGADAGAKAEPSGGFGGEAGSTKEGGTDVPPALDQVEVVSTTHHAITLRFTTSVPTTASVAYDLNTWQKRVDAPALSTTHVVTLDRLMSGSAHAYEITITDSAGASHTDVVRSASTQAYSAEPLPDFWTSLDIGAVNAELPGEAFYDEAAYGGAFIVRGTGTDVFNDADSFHYVGFPVSGDFTFTLKVEGYYGYLHYWTKAMTMFRVDVTPGSAMFNQSINYEGQDYLYYRPVADAMHTTVTGSQLHLAPGAPLWARLERVGNTFTEYISTDGTTWTVNGPASGTTVALPAEGSVGFGVCSKSNDHVSEVVYSNVEITTP